MTLFSGLNFLTDSFEVSLERVNAADILGYGYSIPDKYWEAEKLLPTKYKANNFSLRRLWRKDRWVSWPEADMLLSMDTHAVRVGWRVLSYFYLHQERIPTEWLECIGENGSILFPYALCIHRHRSGDVTWCCPSLFYDDNVGTIECRGIVREPTGATLPIAVYQR